MPRSNIHKAKEKRFPNLSHVIFNMALNDKPGITDYLSTEWLDFMPSFADVFCRRRFLQIHWMFHAGPVSAIRIGKLENLVKHMQEKCFACYLYYPGQDIAIDETTVRSTAGWPFASTIPKSPISGVSKHMLKAYVLTDSFTGYASVF